MMNQGSRMMNEFLNFWAGYAVGVLMTLGGVALAVYLAGRDGR